MPHPIPFPLASGRYEVGPAMRRFGQAGQGFPAEQGHFQPDDRLAETLSAKLSALRQAAYECHLFAPDLGASEIDGLRSAMQASFRLLADEHPAMATADADGVTLHHLGVRLAGWSRLEQAGEAWPVLQDVARDVRAWLSEQEGLSLLGSTLGLAVQEDLAIVRGPAEEGGADVLEWGHICLPSNWAPAEKVGRSFADVHRPIAHSEQLTASGAQIIRAMIHAGPFVRYVWGLHRDGELGHNPRLHREGPWLSEASPAQLADQAWFRVERQTTHGYPLLGRALFTIRYFVEPLRAVVESDPWRRERLASALSGMDEIELRYKGLTPARDHLVDWLQAGGSQ